MRPAREVMARWIAMDHSESEVWDFYLPDSDSLAAALRDDGLVIVRRDDLQKAVDDAADLRDARNGWKRWDGSLVYDLGDDARDRLEAALAEGGE